MNGQPGGCVSKFCPYCGSADVPPRRRYCCDEHRKRTQRQVASERGKTRYALAKTVRRMRELHQHEWRWRQIALGLDADQHLAVVFRPKRKRRAST